MTQNETHIFDNSTANLSFPHIDYLNEQLEGHGIRVLSMIGYGALGVVYKIEYKTGDENGIYAMKILKPTVLNDANEGRKQEALRRFQREAVLGEQLPYWHRNDPAINRIIKVFEWCSWNGIPHMVMEHVEGGTLKDLVKNTNDPREILIPAMQSIEGLALLHDSNTPVEYRKPIIHRDFKPSNILFDQYRNVKLSDLGLAKCGDTLKDRSVVGPKGTPLYMSPEQISQESIHLTAASDIYSFGAVLYNALTGEYLLDVSKDATHGQIYQAITQRKLRSTSMLSEPLAKLIEQCTDEDPSKRPEAPHIRYALVEATLAAGVSPHQMYDNVIRDARMDAYLKEKI